MVKKIVKKTKPMAKAEAKEKCAWPSCAGENAGVVPLRGVERDLDGEYEELEGSLGLPFCKGHIVYAREGLVAAIIADDKFTGNLYGHFDMIRMMEIVTQKVLRENFPAEEETEEEAYGG